MRTSKQTILSSSLLIASLLGLSANAWANDAAFGGRGAALFPIKETRVRMAAEDITMTYVPYWVEYKDREGNKTKYQQWRWQVEATYTFENPTKEEISLKLGFPETRCDQAQDECNGDGRFKKMRTWVREAEVKHTISKSKKVNPKLPAYDRVYLYDVTFKPQETVTIRHSYLYVGSVSVEGIDADYVTRTGSLWNGPIGSARFSVRVPFTPNYLGWRPHQTLKSIEPIMIKDKGYYQVVFEMKDWTPKEDFSLMTSSAQGGNGGHLGQWSMDQHCTSVQEFEVNYKEAKEIAKEGKKPFDETAFSVDFWKDTKDLRFCRNLPYALWGYTFKDKALQARYYKKDALKPKASKLPYEVIVDESTPKDTPFMVIKPVLAPHSSYTEKMLSLAEQRYIKSIKLAEAHLKQPEKSKPSK